MASSILQHIRRLVAIETVSQVSDAALLERFVAQRDESAFALLLKRHGPMVLRLARRLLEQEQDAEDILQATFLLFARKAGSIQKRQSVMNRATLLRNESGASLPSSLNGAANADAAGGYFRRRRCSGSCSTNYAAKHATG